MDVKEPGTEMPVEANEGSPTQINIDLTKSGSFRRYKLTPQEITLMQKGLESLPKELIKHFNDAYLSLMSKFGDTDYFIVMYTSGIKSRRKRRGKNDEPKA